MSRDNPIQSLLRDERVDASALTAGVLRRDQRRLWGLAVVCVVFWMLAVLLPWSTLMPMIAKISRHIAAADTSGAGGTSQQESILLLQAVKTGTVATFVGSALTTFIAALSTVAFILISRRSTLRQVSAQLSTISEQLRQMNK